MTRFARAKGSKSSNEKKPEEASSWSEMKSAMLSKQIKTSDEIPKKLVRKEETPSQTDWASLDDGIHNPLSLLKERLGTLSEKNVKKKENAKSKTNEKSSFSVDSAEAKKKGKKKKIDSGLIFSKELNDESIVSKKNKKRKMTELNVENLESPPEKKKKTNKSEKKQHLNVKEKNKLKKVGNAESESKKELPEIKKKKKLKNESLKGEEVGKEKKFSNGFQTRGKEQFKGKHKQGRESGRNSKFVDRRSKFQGNIKADHGRYVVEELIVNGEKIPIVKFQGFNVTLEDADRLKKLRLDMIKEGIPKNKLDAAIKLERRRAEKALSRLKKAVCFHCRGHGHLLSNCPDLTEKQNTSTGICYKCGSTEHSAIECKVVRGTSYQFAECFICKEQGHIARQCPDNPKGLYPQGGACRECGDVTHLRKDCPQVVSKKVEETVTVGLRNDRDLECLDEEIAGREKKKLKTPKLKSKAVVF